MIMKRDLHSDKQYIKNSVHKLRQNKQKKKNYYITIILPPDINMKTHMCKSILKGDPL